MTIVWLKNVSSPLRDFHRLEAPHSLSLSFLIKHMSADLIWQLVKNNNSFLVKRGRTNRSGCVQFSREPGNVMGVNSFKYSGLACGKTISIGTSEDGKNVTLTTKVLYKAQYTIYILSIDGMPFHLFDSSFYDSFFSYSDIFSLLLIGPKAVEQARLCLLDCRASLPNEEESEGHERVFPERQLPL